jgi:VHL beta domain
MKQASIRKDAACISYASMDQPPTGWRCHLSLATFRFSSARRIEPLPDRLRRGRIFPHLPRLACVCAGALTVFATNSGVAGATKHDIPMLAQVAPGTGGDSGSSPTPPSPTTPVCVVPADTHSVKQSSAAQITFRNRSPGPVYIYWINYSGKRIWEAILPQNGGITFNTFLTHPWLVTTETNQCIRLAFPQAGGSVIDIHE